MIHPGVFPEEYLSATMLQPTPYALRLQQAMDLDGWMKSALAGEMGISPTAVGNLLRGASKSFSADSHVKAVRILRVDSEWLALGIGVPRPEKMAMRDLSYFEGELVRLFRKLPHESQDELMMLANQLYNKQHPMPSLENPFPNAPPPGSTKQAPAKTPTKERSKT